MFPQAKLYCKRFNLRVLMFHVIAQRVYVEHAKSTLSRVTLTIGTRCYQELKGRQIRE